MSDNPAIDYTDKTDIPANWDANMQTIILSSSNYKQACGTNKQLIFDGNNPGVLGGSGKPLTLGFYYRGIPVIESFSNEA